MFIMSHSATGENKSVVLNRIKLGQSKDSHSLEFFAQAAFSDARVVRFVVRENNVNRFVKT